MTEIRPCPFCWAMFTALAPSEIQPNVWAVVCNECGAQGPNNHTDETESAVEPNANAEEAIQQWNIRA